MHHRAIGPALGLAMAVLGAASACNAQGPATPISPLAPVCPAGASPVVTEGEYPVVIQAGTAWNRHEYDAAERSRILYHADAIRQHFTPPPSLGDVPLIGESAIGSWGGARSAHSAVGGKIVLVMKPDGRLRTTFWQVLPFSKTFAIAVTNAAMAADTSGDFLGIPRAGEARGDDTLVVQLRTALEPPAADELPLMRVRLSRYVLEAPSRVTKRGGLYYPDGASYSHVENKGEVLALVGSDGKPVMSATQVTRIEWRDFLSTMTRSIEGTEFDPARSGGCAVPSLSVHVFDFTVRRD